MEFARVVRECPLFERLSVSAEDQQHGDSYQAQREREQFEQSVSSQEDFYRSLLQEAGIAPLTNSTLARISQFANKTNQFNLTTRRYTEQQISQLASSFGWHCFSIRLCDRFGDNGLVGVAITHHRREQLARSIRCAKPQLIGRTVESAFLFFLGKARPQAGRESLARLVYSPLRKMSPAHDFYFSSRFPGRPPRRRRYAFSSGHC